MTLGIEDGTDDIDKHGNGEGDESASASRDVNGGNAEDGSEVNDNDHGEGPAEVVEVEERGTSNNRGQIELPLAMETA